MIGLDKNPHKKNHSELERFGIQKNPFLTMEHKIRPSNRLHFPSLVLARSGSKGPKQTLYLSLLNEAPLVDFLFV
ncbi:hypothetical protein N784_16390 [Pontibacillus litoralis JSM 072002]|uniref:Uncharacterized protein n=1 Tax=Pontibacillus litoralis JSM 072002 TaxID=1385512 RepID=A0A0A5G814_9BACI|nr:hypothetical protein N784_16390 [Pontibacillus litoralis JSM 072002]